MALICQDVHSPFVGRMGSTVGYLWKGRACLRTYRHDINYPNTPSQQRQRDWFVSMVRFASRATAALQLGLRHSAAEEQMTEGNYFVKHNKHCFGSDNGELTVDYEHLQLSQGPAADVYFKAPRFEDNERVSVEFEKNTLSLHASGSDKVYVYFYCPSLEAGFLAAPAERRSNVVRVSLPQGWSGAEVHLYGFVVDREGRASASTYIGVGRVNHYEERGRYVPVNKGWKDFVNIANEVNAEGDIPNVQAADSMISTVDIFADMPLHSPPE